MTILTLTVSIVVIIFNIKMLKDMGATPKFIQDLKDRREEKARAKRMANNKVMTEEEYNKMWREYYEEIR